MDLLLLIVLVFCALGLVTSQHRVRLAYTELQKVQAEAKQLSVEAGQLQLEQSTWATHARIEQEATNRLHMRVPNVRQVRIHPVTGDAVTGIRP